VDADMNCMVNALEEQSLAFAEVTVFPSVADESVRFQSGRYRELSGYRVYNAAGSLVSEGSFLDETVIFQTAELTSGFYFVTFMQHDGAHLTKKLVIRH
jgi:hypothetical protein